MQTQPISSVAYDAPEMKQVVHTTTVKPVVSEWIERRYSSYSKLLHVNAWILRFVSNLKRRHSNLTLNLSKSLSVTELKQSEQHLFSRSQDRYFWEGKQRLISGKQVHSSSSLSSLNPYLGEGSLIVVGGRLSNSKLSYSQKHPPILSHKDCLTRLLLSSIHSSLCHCGPTLVLSHAGTLVHVIGARKLARAVYRSCVTCLKISAQKERQQMGQLPSSRVTI